VADAAADSFKIGREDRSCAGTSIALRDDRWPRLSRDIRPIAHRSVTELETDIRKWITE
jgi:hypothetical protein